MCLDGHAKWLCHWGSYGRRPLQPVLCGWHRSTDSSVCLWKAIECEEHFLAAIYSTESDTNCGSQSESFLRCLRGNFKPCIGPSPNSILLESLSIVVLQSLQGTQLLCESPLHQIAWDDLPPLLQEVATCGDNYAAVVADCGRTFRSKFIPVPSPLCEEFESGKSCIDEARKTHCSFDVRTLRTLRGNVNPFCDNRTRPLYRDAGVCQYKPISGFCYAYF